MKKQFFRILSCCVLLACLCALPAYAQEPKAAQPASKEDKVVTDITGSADLMRNVVGFTTNFGGPYHFAQADHKSPAQAYGDAPAEGAVAVLRLFARADDHGDVPLNTSGHSFLTITNVSEQDINVGGLLIAPDTSITVSTRGNRCEHSGEKAKILAGIMPVVSQRNAIFMENEVNGIHVDAEIIERFAGLDRAQGEELGLEVSVKAAQAAAPYADGFYLMTPFNRVALMERLIARLRTEVTG